MRVRSLRLVAALATLLLLGSAAGCRSHAALTELVEARRLAAELRVRFTSAVDASNRAVMADTDEGSEQAAREARDAIAGVERTDRALGSTLASLAYDDDLARLEAFTRQLAAYKALDAEILTLAVQNTNLKAQRLLFDAARRAADDFRAALDSASASEGGRSAEARASADRATIAVLDIQVVLARHIPESQDAAMTRMEAEIRDHQRDARQALGAAGKASSGPAREALDRFDEVVAQILALSRKNSNVVSLSLALGRKRVLAARCDDALGALERTVLAHGFSATR